MAALRPTMLARQHWSSASPSIASCENKQLYSFDFQFNPKMNRSPVFDLATAEWIGRREDALFLGPTESGKSHIAQAIGHGYLASVRDCKAWILMSR
jgi:DNA replication protein DnaC